MSGSWLGTRQRGGLCRGVTVFLACAGWLALVAPVASAAPCQTGSVTFASTGGEQCCIVPTGVTTVHVIAIGAPGAHGAVQNFGLGGEGARQPAT